jgi:8-oxo-dGTP pyrophosphatase MutT (NUDIX family)
LRLDKIKRSLSTDIVPYLDDKNTKHAAVLVIIYGTDCKIIMTKKPTTMPQHGGEISFPGGKIDESDLDLLDTAIRETKEEISLDISRDHIVGQLSPVHTRNSGFTIIPFIAVLSDVISVKPNTEVDEILHMPLIKLLETLKIDDDENHKALLESYVFRHNDDIIWGASARILKQLADILKQNNLL